MGVLAVSLLNVAAVASLRNLPLTASYGLWSVLFYIMTALAFFLPVSVVCYCLSSKHEGGIYRWVGNSFRDPSQAPECNVSGFFSLLSVWLQWLGNVVWYPTILCFALVSLLPSLAQHQTLLIVCIVALFWLCTLLNCRCMLTSSWIASVGTMLGTLIPALLLLLAGIIAWIGGHTTFSKGSSLVPCSLSSWTTWTVLTETSFAFIGMELAQVHAKYVRDPKITFPRAVLLSAGMILGIYILGTIALLAILPPHEIGAISGLIDVMDRLLHMLYLPSLIPVMSLMLFLGALSTVMSWIIGPTRGLQIAASEGRLPRSFARISKEGVPLPLLITQGCIVTLLTLTYAWGSSVEEGFWTLTVLASQSFLMMYLLLFFAGIRLITHRWGKACSFVGLLSTLAMLLIGLIPPPRVESILFHEVVLMGGLLCCVISPLILYRNPKRALAPVEQ